MVLVYTIVYRTSNPTTLVKFGFACVYHASFWPKPTLGNHPLITPSAHRILAPVPKLPQLVVAPSHKNLRLLGAKIVKILDKYFL